MNGSLRRLAARPDATIRLFCFPYAGGGVAAFRGWAAEFPPDVEPWAIRLPGREDDLLSPPFHRMTDILNALVPAFVPLLDRPFGFFGHSLGALVAWELARSLEQAEVGAPTHLFVSASTPPQVREVPEPPVHTLSDEDLVERIRSWRATSEAVLRDPELMALLLPGMRADFTVLETHEFRGSPLPSCPVTAFGGTEDDGVDRAVLARWAELTTGEFDLRMFPGDHFYLHPERQPLVAEIVARLTGATASTPR